MKSRIVSFVKSCGRQQLVVRRVRWAIIALFAGIMLALATPARADVGAAGRDAADHSDHGGGGHSGGGGGHSGGGTGGGGGGGHDGRGGHEAGSSGGANSGGGREHSCRDALAGNSDGGHADKGRADKGSTDHADKGHADKGGTNHADKGHADKGGPEKGIGSTGNAGNGTTRGERSGPSFGVADHFGREMDKAMKDAADKMPGGGGKGGADRADRTDTTQRSEPSFGVADQVGNEMEKEMRSTEAPSQAGQASSSARSRGTSTSSQVGSNKKSNTNRVAATISVQPNPNDPSSKNVTFAASAKPQPNTQVGITGIGLTAGKVSGPASKPAIGLNPYGSYQFGNSTVANIGGRTVINGASARPSVTNLGGMVSSHTNKATFTLGLTTNTIGRPSQTTTLDVSGKPRARLGFGATAIVTTPGRASPVVTGYGTYQLGPRTTAHATVSVNAQGAPAPTATIGIDHRRSQTRISIEGTAAKQGGKLKTNGRIRFDGTF